MAPVGRWQKGKDLSWYAKNDKSAAATAAAEARKEEIRRIKQAESDALSKALGYEPVDRDNNANNTPIGYKEVEKAIKETAEGDDETGAKGVGFGGFLGTGGLAEAGRDVLSGTNSGDVESHRLKRQQELESRQRREKRERSRNRDRSRERRRRRHTHDDRRLHHQHYSRESGRHRSRSRSKDRNRHRRHRSRSYEDSRDARYHRGRRERSYSPDPRRRQTSRDRDRDYRR